MRPGRAEGRKRVSSRAGRPTTEHELKGASQVGRLTFGSRRKDTADEMRSWRRSEDMTGWPRAYRQRGMGVRARPTGYDLAESTGQPTERAVTCREPRIWSDLGTRYPRFAFIPLRRPNIHISATSLVSSGGDRAEERQTARAHHESTSIHLDPASYLFQRVAEETCQVLRSCELSSLRPSSLLVEQPARCALWPHDLGRPPVSSVSSTSRLIRTLPSTQVFTRQAGYPRDPKLRVSADFLHCEYIVPSGRPVARMEWTRADLYAPPPATCLMAAHSNQRSSVVEFQTPVTVIVGQNGTGKTVSSHQHRADRRQLDPRSGGTSRSSSRADVVLAR